MTPEKTVPLIIIFLIGCFLQKKRILTSSDAPILGKLLANLVIPALIVTSFARIKIDFRLIYLPLSALLVVSALAVLGYLIARQLSLKSETHGAFVTAFPTLEGGAIGYVLMLSAFGNLGLNRIVLFDVANIIFLFTVVYSWACFFGTERIKKQEFVVKIITTPLLWAVLIGVLLNTVGFQHVLLSRLLEVIGDSFSLLMMLMLGLKFQYDTACLKLSSLTILLKTAIGLSLGWFAAMIFGLSGVERAAVIVGSSLPPSMLTLLFAEENHLDTRYVANLLSTALPFALLFLPILLHFL